MCPSPNEGERQGKCTGKTGRKKTLVNLKLEIKVDGQSVDESTASCIQRDKFKLGRDRERELTRPRIDRRRTNFMAST